MLGGCAAYTAANSNRESFQAKAQKIPKGDFANLPLGVVKYAGILLVESLMKFQPQRAM